MSPERRQRKRLVYEKIAGEVGALLDKHCSICPRRPVRSDWTEREKYCMKQCPIGLELKRIGDQMVGIRKVVSV